MFFSEKVSDSFQSQSSGRAYSSSTCEYKWDKSRLLDLNNSLLIFPSLLILMSLVASLDAGLGFDSMERRG